MNIVPVPSMESSLKLPGVVHVIHAIHPYKCYTLRTALETYSNNQSAQDMI